MNLRIPLALVAAAAVCFSLTATGSADLITVDLNYNFNGIWHDVPGDSEHMDIAAGGHEVAGFRSISDRALNGVPSHATLDSYYMVNESNVLDMVHLGQRTFDANPYHNNTGIQPNWLSDPNQTGSQMTDLGLGIMLDGSSNASFIYHVSDGGGNFDVRFGFSSGSDFLHTLDGADWWGGHGTPLGAFGNFPGTGSVDKPVGSDPLGLWEGVIGMGAHAGRTLTSISFENRSNTNSHVGIYAANVNGTAIPEPSSFVMVAMALLTAVGFLRRP